MGGVTCESERREGGDSGGVGSKEVWREGSMIIIMMV